MKEDQVSFTAIMTACIRAYHAMYGEPKVFDDFLAYRLIPEEQRQLIEQLMPREALLHATNAISRARYTEDLLEKAVREGAKQYVILGAGMDTFAFRRPDIVEQLQVFEVDHPATQDFKRRRISGLGWEQPAQLHFLPIDFTRQNLKEVLTSSSFFDPEVKSFFSWLGVTMYLTREDVFATLRSICDITPSGSMIVFDYFDNDEFGIGKVQKKQDMMQQLGEPMKTGFDPATLATDLSSLGLTLHENLSPIDIEERYLQGSNYHAHKHVHFAFAVVK